jgi:hypothetical protein
VANHALRPNNAVDGGERQSPLALNPAAMIRAIADAVARRHFAQRRQSPQSLAEKYRYNQSPINRKGLQYPGCR